MGQRALRAERQRGDGPPYIKDGRQVYYPIPEARQWLLQKLHEPARSKAHAPEPRVNRRVPPQPEPRAARRRPAARQRQPETVR